ncbi:hypothetical protein SAMN05216188_109228 [Lentzea xinjiangensis]|uniref:Uncharacterized protein n=1 Tax=Lentzea xinjiangensis TaxID=402600 RepID=A0A1H9MST6_9PSEU|nr:hypothetical protein [Lentzea xinjiangensis]SER26764.1 hypothetical protein SAMN05216188_109228 [Lentzea xinjiangensis]
MNDTEQLIKEALGQLAERTPHPGPTLNALRRKRKRQRNNIFLIATAGVAAVAVLIFAGVVASDRYAPPAHNDAAAALMPTNSGAQGVEIRYTPHWLPNGYVETFRSVGDETTRVWVPASAKEQDPTQQTGAARVSLRNLRSLPDLAGWAETSVRGLKAWVRTVQGQSLGTTTELVWRAQEVLSVSVRGEGNGQETAMRVADSVRADAKIRYLAPFTLDGKPASDIWGSTLNRWTAQWRSEQVVVTLSTSAPAQAGGTPVTVRGKEGAIAGDTLVVRDSGLWLTVSGGSLSTDELVHTAGRVSLQHMEHPDTNWIGKGL